MDIRGSKKGLDDVTVAATAISHIDGAAGRLVYRGYDAVELARRRSFEDVWHLLVHGDLPADDRFARQVARLRGAPLERATLVRLGREGRTVMLALQAAIAASGAAWGVRPWFGDPTQDTAAIGLRVAAVLPTLVAALWRARSGLPPIDPDPTLGHAANYLWMLEGERPAPERVVGLERYLMLTAEHGMNASTFTARVIASTGADVVAAVAGAAGALAGPLHGGAPSLVLDMLDAIGTAERAEGWIHDTLGAGGRLMGFGHRVYRAEDPRAVCLHATAEELGGGRVAFAEAVERSALAALRLHKPERVLFTNVEFYSAVVLESAGIPRELFTPTFCVARTVGWTAHVLEQIADNRLIRPAADYVGPIGRRLAEGASAARPRAAAAVLPG
jgi:citrate synthase